MEYNFKDIERYWQSVWAAENPYKTQNDYKKPKFYCLDMFPYPSGDGLHVGHWKGYVFSDVFARQKFLQGFNVLHPMGYDAFGLPAENNAIKRGIHPEICTKQNIDKIGAQLRTIGAIYDWDKELSTTDPEYYKWTQWIFLKMFERGLAYESNMPINWCPQCLTGLANEEASGGCCERCGTPVEQKLIRQWVLKITAYADRLLSDLDTLDWPEKVKLMQANWIGKSEGLRFSAPVKDMDLTIETFNAHFEAFKADTFVVIAPDHELLSTLIAGTQREAEVKAFCKNILDKRAGGAHREADEGDDGIEGIFTGRYIIDPCGNGELPIWVASFALAHYGTGMVKCSAHDERDFAFAKKYNIPLKVVLVPQDSVERKKVEALEYCYTDMKDGILLEPSPFSGKRAGDCREEIINYCTQMGYAKSHVSYKLRDWIFSRQRYWGEPIPLVHCKDCGIVAVPESQLPVLLPQVESYQPTGTGESPLAAIDWWVNTICPSCSGPAKRETNTMPQWAGSCWYFLRYPNPQLSTDAFSQQDMNYWMPVDLYVGGIEHAVLHLLYSRFYVKVLYDVGAVPFNEPFKRLFNQGMVCMKSAATGRVEKMSKSKGNTVSPNEIVDLYGVDTLRMYTLFMGPPELDNEWQSDSIRGVFHFLKKMWTMIESGNCLVGLGEEVSDAALRRWHKFLRDYTQRIDRYSVNTAVASVMEFYNDVQSNKLKFSKEILKDVLVVLSIMVPYFSSELLKKYFELNLHEQKWPIFDPELAKDLQIEMAVQVNGKLRGTILTDPQVIKEDAERLAFSVVEKWLTVGANVKVVFVPGRLINFVIK
jgi:leucyl-tRNA synthetase